MDEKDGRKEGQSEKMINSEGARIEGNEKGGKEEKKLRKSENGRKESSKEGIELKKEVGKGSSKEVRKECEF